MFLNIDYLIINNFINLDTIQIQNLFIYLKINRSKKKY